MKKVKVPEIQYDQLYQIVLSGDSGVGKSALLQKFASPNRAWDIG